MTRILPYGRQSIDDADIAAVVEVLRGDFLTTGPAVGAFETDFAAATGAGFAVSCANGTGALHLAALALGLREGDVVVVPSVTFLASANAARFVGAEVCFADVAPDHGLMTPETFAAALDAAGPRAKAVVPVHLNGQCCDMPEIRAVADKAGVAIIEDACHALGGAGVGACAQSDMAAFSLHPVKMIAAGEGGVVTTNDPVLAERLSRMRNHGMVREPGRMEQTDLAYDKNGDLNPWYYEMPEVGFNYRLSDVNAALAGSQLKKMPSFIERRSAIADRYDEAFAGLAPVLLPIRLEPGQRPAWHLYVVLIDFAALQLTRAQIMTQLRALGVGTQVHYLPVHRQPYYRKRYGSLSLPGADAYYEKALSLPLFASMTDDDVETVVAAVKQVIAK